MNITELIKTGECHITAGSRESTRLVYLREQQTFVVLHNYYHTPTRKVCETTDEAEAVAEFMAAAEIINVTSHTQSQSR